MTTPLDSSLAPTAWYVLHLFYTVCHSTWQDFTEAQRRSALSRLSDLILRTAETSSTQLRAFAILTPKADLGFMLLCRDPVELCSIEKRLNVCLGADVLEPVFSYLSLLPEHGDAGTATESTSPSPSKESLQSIPETQSTSVDGTRNNEHQNHSSAAPALPDWPVFSFYPVTKRREPNHNWYRLSSDTYHARLGSQRTTASLPRSRVYQVITESTGLDDADWGVSLFAKDLPAIQTFVEEMRSTSLHPEYTEVGQVFLGLQLPLGEIFRRLQLLP